MPVCTPFAAAVRVAAPARFSRRWPAASSHHHSRNLKTGLPEMTAPKRQSDPRPLVFCCLLDASPGRGAQPFATLILEADRA